MPNEKATEPARSKDFVTSLERGLAARSEIDSDRIVDYKFTDFVDNPELVLEQIYGHFASGGRLIRMASVLPPVFRPNWVPRSIARLNSA